ncbi:MAG: polysaccharide deacetylase family protein [Candidatus Omnitrophica bacterium]|nr:polysaccharide deacetylase family protein [Candidatus Omnitrophota bacterium]
MKNKKSFIISLTIVVFIILLAVVSFTIFFDQAVLVRRGTVYRVPESQKLVAITFDDGPSPVWTPKILDALQRAGVKATFFMIGEHVLKYPEIAKRVVKEGHEIGNHSFDHHVLLYYTMEELEQEVNSGEDAIRKVTGVTTHYFRPPKAWLTAAEKKKLKEMGYEVILWSLNSKDWVTFDDKYIIRYLVRHVRPGDIILFHDSGGVFNTEGGSRHETVLTIPKLVEKLQDRGYKFVTISQLLDQGKDKNRE